MQNPRSRKQIRIVVACFLIGICGWKSLELLRHREPGYNGKPLSFWLAGYCPNGQETKLSEQKADEALDKIGTNAVPTLLRLLQAKDFKLKVKWLAFLRRLDQQYALAIPCPLAWELNYEGYAGFKRLGTNASVALPNLIKIYEQNISAESRSAVVFSLKAINSPARSTVPALVKCLATANGDETFDILEALGAIHSDPDLVIPVIIHHLDDPQRLSRQYAAKGLGNFGADAKPAFNALLNSLKDDDASVRRAARDALIKIDSSEAARAGVK